MSRTRIVCTLGPATDAPETIRALIRSGMNVARLNFSHGSHKDHAARVDCLRKIAAEENAIIALLGDLQGPKIRIGEIPEGHLALTSGETLILDPDEGVTERAGAPLAPAAVSVDFPLLPKVVKPGEHLLLDDGAMELVVDRVENAYVITHVLTGGDLKPHKGVNFPGIDLPVPSLTPKDLDDLEWAISQDLDYLALSFVRRPQDIVELRGRLEARKADIPIIAKIEKQEAVRSMDAILQEADGVMVARGDLGVEMPAEQVPIVQKLIIRKANALGKPVITATQMLESMIENPRPTRAEASDVANAILDGSDAVMLSGETSVGKHPVEAVQAMARIADYTEKNLHENLSANREFASERLSVTDAIGQATVEIAREVGAKAIVTLTMSGFSSRMVARHRPEIPILAVTTRERTRRRLALVWGAPSELIPEETEIDRLVEAALNAAKKCCGIESGQRVVLTAGVPLSIAGRTNMIQVRQVP